MTTNTELRDLFGEVINVGARAVFTAGQGTLRFGTVQKISRGTGRQGPGYLIVDGVKLKLSGHKTWNGFGLCTDRVALLRDGEGENDDDS